MPIIRRKLPYLCDTGICNSVWVASGRPDTTHTEWQIPVSHRYSNFLLMMDAQNMKRREINKYVKQNCVLSWIYLWDCTGMHSQQNIKNVCLVNDYKVKQRCWWLQYTGVIQSHIVWLEYNSLKLYHILLQQPLVLRILARVWSKFYIICCALGLL